MALSGEDDLRSEALALARGRRYVDADVRTSGRGEQSRDGRQLLRKRCGRMGGATASMVERAKALVWEVSEARIQVDSVLQLYKSVLER